MSLENDLVQMRQQIKRLLANTVIVQPGTTVYLTYHDADLDATPTNPTGDGTAGGWHTTLTIDTNWMSTKIGANGSWSYPQPIVSPAGSVPVTKESLIGHYKMNDNLANKAVLDSSGNYNHGIATQNTEDINATGKINGALDFTTDDDRINIASASGLPTELITVCGWCYYNSNKDYNFVVGHEWTGNGWMLYSDAAGQPIFGVAQSGVQTNTVSTHVLTVDTWTWLAGTYDGTTIKIYVNTVLVGSALLDSVTLDSVGDIVIGHKL